MRTIINAAMRMAVAGNLSFDAANRIILEHVRNIVPDALSALWPSGGTRRNLAEAKLAEITGRAAGVLTARLRDAGAP